jgi:predicted AAA+ superfamily ATPase
MIEEILKVRPFISRPLYTDRIKPVIDKEIIKIISGQRREGKSYILFADVKNYNGIEQVHLKDFLVNKL